MFQILRVVFTLGMFIPAMWLFMHLARPYTDAGVMWLGGHVGPWWAIVIILGVPATVLVIAKRFERTADAPPSRLDWLLKRRY